MAIFHSIGEAVRPVQGGGERKGTLTGSSCSERRRPGGGPEDSRPRAVRAAAGDAHTPTAERAPEAARGGRRPSPPLRLRTPPPPASAPGLRGQPPPPGPHTHSAPPAPPPPPNSTHCAPAPPRAPPARALHPVRTHALCMETFISVWIGVKGIGASAAEPGAPATAGGGTRGRDGGGWPAARRPLPSPLQAPELSPCLHLEEAPRMRLVSLPVSRFSFLSAQRAGGPETFGPAASFVRPLRGERASVRRRGLRPAGRAGDAPGFLCL